MPLVEPEFKHPVQRFAHRAVDFRSRMLVMAVVNRTPDSFYDDGARWGAVSTSTIERADR